MTRRPVVRVRAGTATDLEFVYGTERMPGYEELTARWTLEEHAAAMERTDTRYLIGDGEDGRSIGFVILQPFDDRHEGTKIKRIAVTRPGVGVGSGLLSAAIEWTYRNSQAPRIWLDVFTHNARAVAAYRASGMRLDGVLRSAYCLPDGRRVDRYLMSLLRDEWLPAASTL